MPSFTGFLASFTIQTNWHSYGPPAPWKATDHDRPAGCGHTGLAPAGPLFDGNKDRQTDEWYSWVMFALNLTHKTC